MKIEKFDVVGMTCSACVAHVEKSVRKLPGVNSVQVNLLTNSMSVEYDVNSLDAEQIISSIQDAGYDAFPKELPSEKFAVKQDWVQIEQNEMHQRWWISFAFLIPVFLLSMGGMLGLPTPAFLSMHKNPLVFSLVLLFLTFPIYIINRKFFINGFRALWQLSPNMDSLVAIGSSASLIYGIYGIFKIYFGIKTGNADQVMHFAENLFLESGAMILSLVTLGKFLETKSKRKTSSALTKMVQSAPQTAFLVKDNSEIEIPIENVRLGDIISVRSGQKIPVDGEIIYGSGILDVSSLTGESIPEAKQTGEIVLSGSINVSGYFQFKATKVGKDTTFAQIIRLMEDASASKAPISKLADKISNIFVPVVITISVISAAVWLLLGYSVEFSLSIAVAVLIVSCPCALGLATPVAIMAGTGKGAEFGILFKSAEAMEMGAKIDTVLLDKTGTITEGKPKVVEIKMLHYLDENELLKISASLEKLSEHPLSNAVIEKANEMKLELYPVEDFQNKIGKGISGKIKEELYRIGNELFISEIISTDGIVDSLSEISEKGYTPLIIADDENILGIISVSDTIKENSVEAIRYLYDMNLNTVMLTGDRKQTALAMQKISGVGSYIAEVLPQQKDMEVIKLQKRGKKIAMIGDGVNDAPALMRSDLGIAIGSGTDIAIDSADVVLMKSDLLDAVTALKLSKYVMKIIKQNLFWAFFYNVIGIPVATGMFYTVFGWTINPIFAAGAMSISSVTVTLNALRIRNFIGIKKSLLS